MAPAPATGRTLPIRIVSASEIGDNIDGFYRRFATEPLIVRDVYPPQHPFRQLDSKAIEALLGDVPIHVYNSDSPGYRYVPAAEIIAGLRGHAPALNVVDHSIVGTNLGNLFDVPAFLRHNWFLGPPGNRDELEKSLILSPAGSFTSLHLDACAMQGWMYLIAGRKQWSFHPPHHLLAAFDPIFRQFYDPRIHSADQFPLLSSADRYEGTLHAGELLYFPAGWIHQVTTTEMSFGVGGSVLNDYQIEDHMKWWLWERSTKMQGAFELKRVLEKMPVERFSGPAGQAATQSALALCNKWEAHIHELTAQ